MAVEWRTKELQSIGEFGKTLLAGPIVNTKEICQVDNSAIEASEYKVCVLTVSLAPRTNDKAFEVGLGDDEIVGCAAMQADIALVKHEVTKIKIRVGCLTGLKISVAIDM